MALRSNAPILVALVGFPGRGAFGFDADQLETQCVDALEEPVEM